MKPDEITTISINWFLLTNSMIKWISTSLKHITAHVYLKYIQQFISEHNGILKVTSTILSTVGNIVSRSNTLSHPVVSKKAHLYPVVSKASCTSTLWSVTYCTAYPLVSNTPCVYILCIFLYINPLHNKKGHVGDLMASHTNTTNFRLWNCVNMYRYFTFSFYACSVEIVLWKFWAIPVNGAVTWLPCVLVNISDLEQLNLLPLYLFPLYAKCDLFFTTKC